MRAFSLAVIGLGLANAVDLPQDIYGEGTCTDVNLKDITYQGTCECEENCCTGEQAENDGCPVDIVIGIDMCSCNNQTWTDMKEFSRRVVNALNEQFGISDTDNSGRIAVFQFMEDVHDVVGLETFTKKEILKKVNKMENTQFHGKGTDMVKAIQHGKKILEGSNRKDLEGIQRVFAVITNGYSDQQRVSDTDVATEVMDLNTDQTLKTVFVAREDSSISNRGSRTNTMVAEVFAERLRLKDPVAPQQLVGDIECPAPPPPEYSRQCNCVCDVPMGCHGITGEPGQQGKEGKNGNDGVAGPMGENGEQGDDGPMGETGEPGGCGMPGLAGEKGLPGDDGIDGIDGQAGGPGIVGPRGAPGQAGIQGDKGDTGEPGEGGQPGVQGEPGVPGDEGKEGPPGELDTKTLKWLVNKIFIEELNAMGLHHPMT